MSVTRAGRVPVRAGLVRWWPESLAVMAALIWAALAYRTAHGRHFAVVANPALPTWWEWSDQGRYYRAARAWASWSLDPTQHWYFAGYALLGAAMFRLMPGQPFYVVNLACLILFGLALAFLARRLADRARWAVVAGAAVFVLTVVLTPFAMKAFVEPWTTTPTAFLSLGAFLMAFRLWERPSAGRAAGLGLVAGSIALFRPTDVIPLGAALAFWTLVSLRTIGWRRLALVAGGGIAGAAVPLAVTVASYVAVFGFSRNTYLLQSAETGFEWRLIPLHWVTLFVSPQLAFPDEFSLSQRFPWVVPGVAGMVACLVSTHGETRRRHGLVISAVALHCSLYMAYRDLHPQGLFRFANYHYFKWCLPVFGLYAVFLVTEVVRRPQKARALGAGAVVTLGLFSWRAPWREVRADWVAQARVDGRTLTLPQAPRSVYDGLFVPAAGGFSKVYLSSYEMRIGDRVFHANADFKAFPVAGGLILMVLRPMPEGPAVIRFADGVQLLPGAMHMLRLRFRWQWPHVGALISAYSRRWHVDT